MTQKIIYPTEKDFIETTNNAILLIEKPDIPKNILEYADNNSLKLKNKFHITIIGTKYDLFIRDFILKIEINKRQKIQEELKNLFEKYDWKYQLVSKYSFLKKYYTQEELNNRGYYDQPEQNRLSIIQIINLPDLKDFYQELNILLGTKLEIPFEHISLFSGSDYQPMEERGIGIYTEKDFLDSMVEEIK